MMRFSAKATGGLKGGLKGSFLSCLSYFWRKPPTFGQLADGAGATCLGIL
jgi:hypothetical protein